MSSISITPGAAGYTSGRITADHFGSNVVYTKDFLDPGGPFDRFLNQLHVDLLRYPGGTVTEENFGPGTALSERLFSLATPSGVGDGDEPRILTAPAVFDYAATTGADVILTLPTDRYFSDAVDSEGNRMVDPFGAYRLIDRVDEIARGTYGDAPIDLIQIGNEFWYEDDRQTAEEYGRIANDLSVGLQRIFDINRDEYPESWTEPAIAVQAAQGWRPDENEAILSALSPEARAAIDAVTQNFYPRAYGIVENSPGAFDRMDDFAAAEGFGELDYYLSEWNVRSDGIDKGLLQASTMLEITRTFLERGVDFATVWGTQYQALQSRLAELVPDDSPSGLDYRLTAPGELFAMMNPGLRGLRVIDTDTDPGLRDQIETPPQDRPPDDRDQVVMHGFGSDDRTVLFVSSRTDEPVEVTLDPSGLLGSWQHLYGRSLGVIDDPATSGRDEGDPESAFARPYIALHDADSLIDDGALRFTLDAYEIMRLEFSQGAADLSIFGHDQIVDPDADYDDRIFGGSGDDSIFGFHGDDRLRGGLGNDTLSAGAGSDRLFGGFGDDLLLAGLSDASGSDTLRGGPDEDTLVSGPGETFLDGNIGRSHFVVDPQGDAIITGFETEKGDTLSFLRTYDRPEDVLDRAVAVEGDIVISHDQGGMTELIGAADQLDRLAASLSDFDPESPVAGLVDRLTQPEPDGSIPPAPPGVADDPRLLAARDFEELLNGQNMADIQAMLDGYSTEQLAALSEYINPDALLLTAPAMLSPFLSRLDNEALDSFFDRLDGDAVLLRLRDPELPELWNDAELDPDILERFLNAMDAEDGEALFGDYSDAALRTLVDQIESRGLDTADYDVFSSQQDRIDGLTDPPEDQFPLPPTDPPDEDPDEDEEDPDRDSPGGRGDAGCFVATCAYGNIDHPDVQVLRLYRDLCLADSWGGRAFTRTYYRVGPHLARKLAPHPRLRALVRSLIGLAVRTIVARSR